MSSPENTVTRDVRLNTKYCDAGQVENIQPSHFECMEKWEVENVPEKNVATHIENYKSVWNLVVLQNVLNF